MAEAQGTPPAAVKGGVVAYLSVEGAIKAGEFYKKAFAAEQVHINPPDEKGRTMHVHLYINGGSVMLSDVFPEFGQTRVPMPGEHATVSVSLEYDKAREVDDICARAAKLGAKIETAPTNSFWGTRYASLRDPFGHIWSLHGPLKK